MSQELKDGLIFEHVGEVVGQYLGGDVRQPIPTGLIDLDRLIGGGLGRGEFTLVGGVTGVGKTALAVNIAANAAFRGRFSVGFFSAEMKSHRLAERFLCREGALVATRLRDVSNLNSREVRCLNEAKSLTRDARLYLCHSLDMPLEEVIEAAELLKLENGLDLFIVDNLDLISLKNRRNRVSLLLKRMAEELDVATVGTVTTTFNRLRTCRAASVADLVMFLHRADMDQNGDESLRGMLDVAVIKNRSGITGSAWLFYMNHTGAIATLELARD